MNGDNSETGLQVVQSNDNQMAFSLLLADIKAIIKEARSAAYAGINAVQIDQNWKIGKGLSRKSKVEGFEPNTGKERLQNFPHICVQNLARGIRSEICEISALSMSFSPIVRFGTRVCQISVGLIFG